MGYSQVGKALVFGMSIQRFKSFYPNFNLEYKLYFLLVALPLFSSISSGFFGRYLGFQGSAIITVGSLFFTFFLSLIIFYEVSLIGCNTYIDLITWVDSETLNVSWGFMFDSLTTVMLCVVLFVSTLVHLYSTEYMSHDPHLPRFMSYLSLFTFFMLILVTADNFIQMFVGWEGVGLCSFLLINFWFTRIQANKSAIKAMVLNRIGDFGLVLGILTIYVNYKALDYATIFSLTPFFADKSFLFLSYNFYVLDVICLLLFVGAIGKSAQLGLHTWLPDAMEGPTPVSALIHAATMVTAGVFLIARTSPIYEFSLLSLDIVTLSGAATAFFAASVGLLQNDLKKVIAYSTCSQLGYMVFACGLSNYSVGVFHLLNHAFFKALLFLGAGSVIHAMSDEQDMRKMGGLKFLIPFTYSIMIIGSLALMGFPFLAGFYSKDVILEVAYSKFTITSHFSYILGTLSAFLTAFYSIRLISLTFLVNTNAYKPVIQVARDSSYQISLALLLLTIPSMFVGFYFKDMLIGLGTDFWGNSIFVLPNNSNLIESEFIDQKYKLLPLLCSLLGAYLSFRFYRDKTRLLFQIKISKLGKKFYNFLNKKWFFDKFYNESFGQFFFKFGYSVSYKIIDKGVIEFIGPSGMSKIISVLSYNISKFQSGYLYNYTFLILLGGSYLFIAKTFSLFIPDFNIFVVFLFLIFLL